MDGPRDIRVALICVFVLVTAGCTGFLGEELTEEELLTELEDIEPPEEMTATVETEARFEDEAFEMSYDAWYRLSGESRTEAELEGEELIEINDGEQYWSYNVDENTVRTAEPFTEESPIAAVLDATEELIRAGNVSDVQETEYDGRDAYLVVFDDGEESGDSGLFLPPTFPVVDGLFGTGDGDENNGGATTVFDAERVELVVDAEYMFLLRQTVEGEEPFEMRYSDVAFEPGLSDDIFEFEPPEDATIEEILSPDIEEFETVEEAQEDVPFEIPEPEFDTAGLEADEFDRQEVQVISNENGTTVNVQYESPDEGALTVLVGEDLGEHEQDGETVSVGETTGAYDVLEGEYHRLTWSVDGLEYTVFTEAAVDREALVALAESIEHESG